jgi:opacity protein-like surface antigen
MSWFLQLQVRTKDMVMSRKLLLLAASVAFLSGAASVASAADIIDPPVVDLPEPSMPVAHAAAGGWYLRGDVGYSMGGDVDADYVVAVPGPPVSISSGLLRGQLKDNYSFGAGIGYDTGNYLRVDLTADYFTKTNFNGSSAGFCNPVVPGPLVPCTTTDTQSLSALSIMANAYIDLGKFNGITPYVGAGIGGTHVSWGTLNNDYDNTLVTNADETHPGAKNWRFTYAVMAGASYDVSDCFAIDAGYRYRKIEGGKMFGVGSAGTTGPAHDKGFGTHDFRIGARYKLAGLSGGCGGSHVPDYQPDYQPVYK